MKYRIIPVLLCLIFPGALSVTSYPGANGGSQSNRRGAGPDPALPSGDDGGLIVTVPPSLSDALKIPKSETWKPGAASSASKNGGEGDTADGGRMPTHGFDYAWNADGGMRITPRPDRNRAGFRELDTGAAVSLHLRGIGDRTDFTDPGEPGQIHRTATGFAAGREGITETYSDSGMGLDHGFVVHGRPEHSQGSGILTLSIGMETGLAVKLQDPDTVIFEDRTGRGVWTYSHLAVEDAGRRPVPAWMDFQSAGEGREARVLLCIRDALAEYPLTVDPTFASAEITRLPNPPAVVNNSSGLDFSATLGDSVYFPANDGAFGKELWKTDPISGTVSMVKDIRPGSFSSEPEGLTVFKNFIYFRANDGLHQAQLWRTDGTEAGTTLFYDFTTAGVAYPDHLRSGDDFLYFDVYKIGSGGAQIWRTDGTPAGTRMLLSSPGQVVPDLREAVTVGNVLIYPYNDEIRGMEVWRSDGTAAGTRILRDFIPGSNGSFPKSFKKVGEKVFFLAAYSLEAPSALWMTDGTDGGTVQVTGNNTTPGFPMGFQGDAYLADLVLPGELWRTDGTPEGTVKVWSTPTVPGLQVRLMGVTTDSLYFVSVWHSGADLYRTDGTAGGTTRVISLGKDNPYGMQAGAGNRLYFERLVDNGTEVWSTDGTETGTLKLTERYTEQGGISGPVPLGLANGIFYFSAEDEIDGREIWRSDGTAAGTELVRDIVPNAPGLRPSNMTIYRDKVVFEAFDPENGRELWASDGTAKGTSMIRNLKPGPEWGLNFSTGHQFTVAGDNLFLIPDTGVGPRSLWRTDGTSDGTFVLKTPISGPFSSGPYGRVVTAFRDLLLIPEADALWRSDGTPTGTYSLGVTGGEGLTPLGEYCLFIHRNEQGVGELWRTDGSRDRTMAVPTGGVDLYISGHGSMPVVNGQALFLADDHTRGVELWKTDGTTAGTTIVRDISPGAARSDLQFVTQPDTDRLYFSRFISTTRTELWCTDASAAGTLKLAEFRPGPTGAIIFSSIQTGGSLYFAAYETASGYELWYSNGTVSGTRRMKDINPGASNSLPDQFQVLGGKAIFLAEDPTSGREPWVSDGTPAGTLPLKNILPGAESSQPVFIGGDGRFVYLAATDPEHGRELWITDGTPEGTRLAEDLAPGRDSSFPFWVGNLEGKVVAMYESDPASGGFGLREVILTPVPQIRTGNAREILTNAAILTGELDTDGGSGSAYFEYGLTTGYGSETPPQEVATSAGVEALIAGLSPASVVHYRLVYTAAGETIKGLDQSLLTRTLRIFAGADTSGPEVFSGQSTTAFFARIPEGTGVSHPFTILNSGTAPVRIQNLLLPDTFSIAGGVFPADIGSGQNLTFEISQFSAKFGSFFGDVVLTADGGYPAFSIPVQAQVDFVNDPPAINPLPLRHTPEDTPLKGTLSASDPDDQPLTFVTVGPALNGTVSIETDGTFTFVPARDFSGTASFAVKATDGSLDSAVLTVTIEVLAVADPPQLDVSPLLSTAENQQIAGALKGSSVEGRDLTYSLSSQPDPGSGMLAFLPDGTFLFQPAKGFNGAAAFVAKASDGVLDSNSVLVVIIVTPVNDPPVLSVPDSITAVAGMHYSFPASASDPDNAPGFFQWTVNSSNSALLPAADILLTGAGGARTLGFTPAEGSPGGSFSITVKVSDGTAISSREISVTVIPNRIELTRHRNGTVQLLFTGVPGTQYSIEQSTDLSQWTLVQHFVAAGNGEIRWSNPLVPASRSFYRLSLP